MKFYLTAFVLFLSFYGKSQNVAEYSEVDVKIMQMPESYSTSSAGIANYINSNFSTQKERARAIFFWVSANIIYDVKNMYNYISYTSIDELNAKTLKTKTGVCINYALLFNDIATKTGIKTHLVSGYTKQNGIIDKIPHHWCLALIDSTWYYFDPTWSAGYIKDNRFVQKYNDEYFMTSSEKMMKNHIPFDPLWQFSYFPVTHKEFISGIAANIESRKYFNFADTLKKFENETETEQLLAANKRIEIYGIENTLIKNQIEYNQQQIEQHNNKKSVDIYNEAISYYNESIIQLNLFIDYRNKQFSPEKQETEVRQMLLNVENLIATSNENLKGIKNPELALSKLMIQLKKMLGDVSKSLSEQKTFVDKYYKTSKPLRKTLFYK